MAVQVPRLVLISSRKNQAEHLQNDMRNNSNISSRGKKALSESKTCSSQFRGIVDPEFVYTNTNK